MFGIGPRHIRLLTDNPWEGGGGYTPQEVRDMTIDQVYMRLSEAKHLRGGKKRRVVKSNIGHVVQDSDGMIKGRTKDGEPLRLPWRGESLAARLTREAKEEQLKPRKRRGKNEY